MSSDPRGAGAPTISLLALDDEFDPLAVDDTQIDQEWMDDDNPYDTVDFPTMRNMPETPARAAVYTPERQGSAKEALRAMVRQNPARRTVLMGIVGLCEGGCASSAIAEKVREWQQDNWSVYEPMTLCRMLERAGALRVEMPATTEERVDAENGVAYLEIKERIDPVWHALPEALELRAELASGESFRDLVLGQEVRYLDVYEAVMERGLEGPFQMDEIEEMVGGFEVARKPRRFGQHFVDVLQAADCVIWGAGAWNLTETGKRMLPELKAAKGEE